MRVLIAPDCFGGTLSAVEVAETVERVWRRAAPCDKLVLRPLADGGPGFMDVLYGGRAGLRLAPGALRAARRDDSDQPRGGGAARRGARRRPAHRGGGPGWFGQLVTTLAEGAARRGLPCIVLAGKVSVGRREAAAVGISAAYAAAELAGSVQAALADPAGTLEVVAEHAARQWGGR